MKGLITRLIFALTLLASPTLFYAQTLEELEAELNSINKKEDEAEKIASLRSEVSNHYHSFTSALSTGDIFTAKYEISEAFNKALLCYSINSQRIQYLGILRALPFVNSGEFQEAAFLLEYAYNGFLDLTSEYDGDDEASIFSYEEVYFRENPKIFAASVLVPVYINLGKLDSAKELVAENSEAIRKAVSENPDNYINILYILSSMTINIDQQNFEEVSWGLQVSEDYFERYQNSELEIMKMSYLKNKAEFSANKGEFRQAEDILNELMDNPLAVDPQIQVASGILLSRILMNTGNESKSDQVLDDLKPFVNQLPESHILRYDYAIADIQGLVNSPLLPETMDQLVDSTLNAVLDEMAANGLQGTPTYYNALISLLNYFETFRMSLFKAYNYRRRIDEILEDDNMPESMRAWAYNYKGKQLMDDSDWGEATRYFQMALDLEGQRQNPDVLKALNFNLGKIEEQQGNIEEAEKYYIKSYDYLMEVIYNRLFYLSEKEKERVWAFDLEPQIEDLKRFIVEYKKEDLYGLLLEIQINTKGIIMEAGQTMLRQARNSNDPEVKREFEYWLALKNQMALVQNKQKDNWDFRLQERIKLAETKLSRLLNLEDRDSRLNWKTLQNSLTEDQLLIDIFRREESDSIIYSYVLLEKSYQQPKVISRKFSDSEEAKLLRFYRNAMRYGGKSDAIYAELYDPVLKNIDQGKSILISQDGIYHFINPHTITEITERKWKVEVIAGPRVLLSGSNTHKSPNPIQFFGNPTYYQSDSSERTKKLRDAGESRLASFSFSQLPGTEEEVKAISDQMGRAGQDSELFLGDEATEAKLKNLVGPEVLHIATHGYFMEPSEDEYLVDPMIHSGLIMAYPKSNSEDGFLTAMEMSQLNLDGTKLVVLSACESGLGSIESGGFYGLGRAIQLAGAEYSLLSLWKVSDEETKELMVTFYQELNSGKSIQKGYLSTMDKIKKIYPEPFYWGAFVLVRNR